MEEMEDKKEVLEQLKQVKALSEDILDYQSVNIQDSYSRVKRRMHAQSRKQVFWHAVSRIAVILLLPLLITSLAFSYLYYLSENKPHDEVPPVTYNQVYSAPGTVTRLELPDRSVVWLNSRTTLTYPSVFKEKEREVKLSGEAYFEVTTDPDHPFYVTTTEGLKVMAYGTKFNVNAYGNEPTVDAALEEGEIDVINQAKQIKLDPGKQAVFDKGTGKFAVSIVNLEEITGWKDGRLVFRNAPLDIVLKKLSKRYNVNIVLHQKGNKIYRYRATFTTETIEQILSYLKLTAPIEWTVKRPTQNQDASYAQPRIDVYLE